MSEHDGTIAWAKPPTEMVERIRRFVNRNKLANAIKRAVADLADEWRTLGDVPTDRNSERVP